MNGEPHGDRSERVDEDAATRSWNREYRAGRYLDEPPLPFVDDILAAARAAGLRRGLYIGCGNGRNFLPLVRGGLDLVGLDISNAALAQLAERAPELRDRLVCGDLSELPPGDRYDLVIGIQVFQHGTRSIAHTHVRAAQARVNPSGLMAVRVNAVDTDVVLKHRVTEREDDGGFTVRYLEGPKQGLDVHFFARDELDGLFSSGFEPVVPPRLRSTPRQPATRGQWSQWEGIWRRTGT